MKKVFFPSHDSTNYISIEDLEKRINSVWGAIVAFNSRREEEDNIYILVSDGGNNQYFFVQAMMGCCQINSRSSTLRECLMKNSDEDIYVFESLADFNDFAKRGFNNK